MKTAILFITLISPLLWPFAYAALGGTLIGICNRLDPSEKPVTSGTFLFALSLWPLLIFYEIGAILYKRVGGGKIVSESEESA